MTAVTSQLGDASTVLLAAPSMGGNRSVCSSLLAKDVESPGVLFVTFTRGARACVSQWEDTGADAARLGVLTVGESDSRLERDDVETYSVSSASDLTGMGIKIGQVLSEWEPPVVVCFDSLTSMLQYVDFETAYEFLHAITGQFYAAGARAHFHVDPEAHQEKHVEALTSLFDARVTLGDGDPVVRTRDLLE